ncbi:MAG: germination protein YpeB [Clostridia bacterium]|nr:germination protein YpeB [Clostridia bacterium]
MMDKLEKKIKEIKEQSNKKVVAVIAFMIFGAMCIFAMEMTNQFKRQKQQVQNEYNKAMYQAVGYIKNIETDLAKLQITNTERLTITTLSSIWKQSNLAKQNLEEIPLEQNSFANVSKYLSQLSDYSYSLINKTILEEKLTDQEYDNIQIMYEECNKLSAVMSTVYQDLNEGRIKWDELKKIGNQKLSNVEVASSVMNIASIAKAFQEYEGLIYDGAFSDHLLSRTPKYLTGADVSKEEAKSYIINLFGEEEIESITEKEDTDGEIYLYNFDVKLKTSNMIRNISITRKDCKLYYMIADRKVENENIVMNEAKRAGKAFLKKLGIEDVKDTYYLKTGNMAIINYAGTQDGIILYPDLIKVKVALDTGEVCSVESQGYIFNHTKRTDITPNISMQQAKSKLNNNIEVMNEGIAIIPTDSKNEILTYEFKGMVGNREFLIYINTKTAQEERVLMIRETPGGILTM